MACKWIVLFLFSQISFGQKESSLLDLVLEVGTSEILPVEPEEDLKLSQRGIIDVSPISKHSFRLTALKSGFVLIKVQKAGELVQTYRVRVEKPASEVGSTPPQMIANICSKEKSLRCDLEAQIAEGTMDDFRLFFQLKNLCKKAKTFIFAAFLSEDGIKAARKAIRQEVGGFDFEVTPSGKIVIYVPCIDDTSKELQKYKEEFGHEKVLLQDPALRCQSAGGYYTIESQVYLTKDLSSQDWDLFKTMEGYLAKNQQIELFLKENKMQIVAEPIFLVREAKEATVLSGGEVESFAWSTPADGPITRVASWKEYGFKMKVRLQASSEDAVFVKFHFSIKQPQQGGQFNNLNSNSIESEAYLPLAENKWVACVELGSTGESNFAIPYLAKIPLIAPFFRGRADTQASSKVLISFRVRKDQDIDSSLEKKAKFEGQALRPALFGGSDKRASSEQKL